MTQGESFKRLEKYIEKENYKGYDPYDTLNSFLPFKWLGKWGPILALQFQKRNPVNIRPLIGIKKEVNPKAYGLFLQAYSVLYKKTSEKAYLEKAGYFFKWLSENYSKGYSGKCWGYNFPWPTEEGYIKSYEPSAVATGFVISGLFEYYSITKKKDVSELMESACLFLDNDLMKHRDGTGSSISYLSGHLDVCYNASLLAAESLSKMYSINGNLEYKNTAIDAVKFVIARQKEDGSWNYSLDLKTGHERVQIDFHQGYVLESIFEIKKHLNVKDNKWDLAIEKGLKFYVEKQFNESGRSFWRLPKTYPVEIHNQSQGIITLVKLKEYNQWKNFENKIFDWTVNHMQAKDGHFYYQKSKYYTNKISYMRWSQAWMFLALAHLK
jgi:hypothetical protein